MQILKALAKIPIRIDDDTVTVKEGHKFIVPNHLAKQFEGSPYFEISEFINEKEIKEPTDFSGKRVIAMRTGGFGDLMFVGRSLLEIKRRFPDSYLELASAPRFSSLITECFLTSKGGFIDEKSIILLPYPHYEKCDYFVSFEGFVENNNDALGTNAFNLIAAQKFFLHIGLDHTVPLCVPKKYEDQANEISNTWTRPVIGIQVKASATLRTYPYPYQNALIRMLDARGFDVLLLDNKEHLEPLLATNTYDGEAAKHILRPYSANIGGSMPLSIALTKKCAMLICPDSFFTYVGDSFGIPTIGIFSPVASACRATGLNVYAIDTIDGCFNCQKHSTDPCVCNWSNDTWSPCIKSILPEYVNYVVGEILEGKK